jgi:hypothetical protein
VIDTNNFTKIYLKPPVDTLCSIFRHAYRPIDLLILRLFNSTVSVKNFVDYPLRIRKSVKFIAFCICNTQHLQIRLCFSSLTFLDFIYFCVLGRLNQVS